ncbi:uncharacterized protein F4822DRAFT_398792 [Hypoxylon trugodes]|uniref:uncharacterized protein n=1 Tax=Hypoxylon trugodes TaxID=326681 RepID=UPI00219E9B5A|nr:uncharacterized protein F4822DRAFT_398792 [Hypoxylon trugodes]KAI1389555.1 hypothetical protein F4822DRAFT_398792 [Hypoxylon trugodes]
MPKTKAHLRSSRRVPSLRDSEIDHEISLVDHTEPTEEPRSPTSEIGNNIDHSVSNQPLIPSESRPSSTQPPEAEDGTSKPDNAAEAGPSGEQDTSNTSTKDTGSITQKKSATKENGVKIHTKRRSRLSKEPETSIDILYENQRGGFLCGLPLFSSAALGNLDPPAWTNFAHKPSPTDINTAQVPDPSWEWAWPAWRVNHDDEISLDGEGWEYSFMFSKKFSWHGPKWYSSFVRRRAWIRKRVKKGFGYQANDPHMLNPTYFAVTPTRTESERVSLSQAVSRVSQETGKRSRLEDGEGKEDLTTIEDLMMVLRHSRIDREKLEAMENYIQHCTDDLQQLQDYMHEIMSLFVFQATRQLLLARLIQLHDDQTHSHSQAQTKEQKGKTPETNQRKAENLAAAIKHADEEVRKLEYWSDIKGMAESGESRGAVDCGEGWDRTWEGLDNSGPKGVREGDTLP